MQRKKISISMVFMLTLLIIGTVPISFSSLNNSFHFTSKLVAQAPNTLKMNGNWLSQDSLLLARDSLNSTDELDSVLKRVVKHVKKAEENRGVLETGNFMEQSIDNNRQGTIGLKRTVKDRDIIKAYWTQDEIQIMNEVVRSNEKIVYNCRDKYNDQILVQRGFIRVQFEVKSSGIVDKSTVKILETNINNEEFIACVVRRIKYFKGFPKATFTNAQNYSFTKKWYF